MAATVETLAFLSKQIYSNYKQHMGDSSVVVVTSYQGFERIRQSDQNAPATYYAEAWKNQATGEVIIVNRGTATGADARTNGYIAAGSKAPTVDAAQDFAKRRFGCTRTNADGNQDLACSISPAIPRAGMRHRRRTSR